MSTLRRLEARTPLDAPAELGGQTLADEVYLTDGTFLYRVVEASGSGADDVVEVEDCYLLDVVEASIGDLLLRGLRVVTPAVAGE
jgi:hypothetical protein